MLFHIYHCLRSELEYCLRALGHDHHAQTTLPDVVLTTAQSVVSPLPAASSKVSAATASNPAASTDVTDHSMEHSAPAFHLEPNEKAIKPPTTADTDVHAQALQMQPVVRLPDLPPSAAHLPSPTTNLLQSKLILIIDLDMTLVHAIHDEEAIARFNNWLYGASHSAEEETWKKTLQPQLHAFDLVYIDDDGAQRLSHILIKVRPGVQALLHTLASSYEMMVYTQGEDQYAENVMAFIDPDG